MTLNARFILKCALQTARLTYVVYRLWLSDSTIHIGVDRGGRENRRTVCRNFSIWILNCRCMHESRAVAQKTHDAALDAYRHRAVLPAIARLVLRCNWWLNRLMSIGNVSRVATLTCGQIDVIYTDLEKAFDKVPHRRLISKLHSYCIHTDVVEWITCFLTNRRQRAQINDSFSLWATVFSGIP